MTTRVASSKPSAKAPNGAVAPDDPERLFTIGELAAAHNITTRTIRFYEARSLISPARKGVARMYTRRDRARLTLILRGKNLGFTLEEIQHFLELYDSDPSQVAQAQVVLERVEAHITDLMDKRADLDRTLKDLKELKALCVGHLKAAGG
jgi:DNA-binding transcriptional MerR regulator